MLQAAKLRENKQTNTAAQCRGGLHLYLQPVRAVSLLPLTRTLPRPCCQNKAPAVCPHSGENCSYDWGHSGKLKVVDGQGGLGIWLGAEWLMGCVWEPCPSPPGHFWKGPVRCQFAMQISPLQANFGKRRINGWQRAGLSLWQMSFPFWFLTSFSGLLLQKPLPFYCVLQSQPTLSFCTATVDSEGKENTKFRVPIHIGGSNCHSHWDGVKYVRIRMREKENWKFPPSVRWEANVVNYRGHYRYTLICH